MSSIQVTTEGKENIHYLIRNLEDFEKDKAVKSGLRAGASVFQRKGKSNLKGRLGRHSTGSLLGSFQIRVKRNKPGVLAGFRRSTRYVHYSKAGNHAHLVDLGTKERKTTIGKSRGVMPANRFWTDAATTEKDKAMQKVYEGVKRCVERINERR